MAGSALIGEEGNGIAGTEVVTGEDDLTAFLVIERSRCLVEVDRSLSYVVIDLRQRGLIYRQSGVLGDIDIVVSNVFMAS